MSLRALIQKVTPALTWPEFSCLLHPHPIEYQRIPDSTIPQEDYRCWPSYHHGSCLLSVFNLAEAVDVCESHAQCQAFVVTNQTTWTGEQEGEGIPRKVVGLLQSRLTDSGSLQKSDRQFGYVGTCGNSKLCGRLRQEV